MWQSNKEWFKALQRKHIPNDVLYMRSNTTLAELVRYEVLVYPHPAIMSDDTAALLDQYVQQGGKLIFGCRTGYKDITGQCYMRPFPGAAQEMCGVTVEEFTMVKGTRQPTSIRWTNNPGTLTGADAFNDILHVEEDSVEVMGTYATDYYAGKPAVTRNKRGKGEVWYFGAVFNEQAVLQMIGSLGLNSPAAEWLELPPEIELQIRASEDDTAAGLTFLLNYSEEPAEIVLKESRTDLLSGQTVTGSYTLDGYGVLVLE
jgi:beta-galactosidase